MTPEEMITDGEIDHAWGNANFGDFLNQNKRELINNTLLKCASGYSTGATAKAIVRQLKLVKEGNWTLTKKGKEYLYEAFSNGKSY